MTIGLALTDLTPSSTVDLDIWPALISPGWKVEPRIEKVPKIDWAVFEYFVSFGRSQK